ncbi:HAMP domain-containing sensor histidine kinase [Marinilactibacillus piezotolerans]|uniref:HAMP domain-containing sensor histidine kinase n=1 Tax=Marinilactibacillus piezotolerans TaxID=258723 RepID=UPI0009B0E484|nr:HAMP domain-containing sensor histidine kinase [Marinilactibacillus piezotolerans]
MKNKVTSQLWVYLTILIFILLVVTTLSFIAIVYFLTRWNIIHPEETGTAPVLLIFGVYSITMSTAVTAFVVRRVLRPIVQLRENMEKVAERDFSIQMDQQQSIKEVQELYTSFNAMVRELNSVELLRSEFTSTVSHEFKTPVATIQGYVQLLQQTDLTPEERQAYYHRILNGTQQLATLSDNILNLTKISNEQFSLSRNMFSLDEQIREVILFLQPKWEKEQLDWNIDLEPSTFNGDEELLYQVWLNLIDNAIKYNKPYGKISVTLRHQNDRVTISLSDTGIGMKKETTEKLFERFYQEDTTRKTQGNGLGLALVKEIIDLHEGEIQVESTSGKGTVIGIVLPADKVF